MTTFFLSPAEVLQFTVVFFRVAGIMVFAPFYASGAFPVQVKIIIPLMAALALAPLAPPLPIGAGDGLTLMVVSLLGEALIGMVLGVAAALVFAGIQLAGQIIGFQVGFSIINVIDPQTAVETSVISILHNFIGLTFFLMLNGHHWFFRAVSDSLAFLPPGGVHLSGSLVEELLQLSGQVFVSGIRIAAPVVAVTVISDIVIGVIGRAAPQINILIVGMPVKTLVGLAGLSVSFYFLPSFLGPSFLRLLQDMTSLLHKLA